MKSSVSTLGVVLVSVDGVVDMLRREKSRGSKN
jgi:hypothetical protein